MRRLIHWFKDTIGGPEETYRVRIKDKFPQYNLTSGEAEGVYVDLLRNRVAWKDVPDLAVLTSGIHLLYMYAIVVGMFATFAEISNIARPTWPLWLTAVLAARAGLSLDRRAERTETALLFGVKDAVIRRTLEHAFPARAQALSLARHQQTETPSSAQSRNDLALEQILLADRVIAHELELRGLGIGVVAGAVDLRRGQITPRVQFGRVEPNDHLSGMQFVAFLREDFFHPSAHARPDVHFIHLDRARDGVVLAMTGRREQQHREEAESAETI